MESSKDEDEEVARVCRNCNKGFSSGKALGGHMRMHAHSSRKQSQSRAKPNTRMLAGTGSSATTCCPCRKSFPSMKSLFGHMRSHAEREWSGIQPPSCNNSTSSSSSSSSSSTLSDDSAVDLSHFLKGWSVTAKRGRKRSASWIEQRMQEAVHELMLLAHGNPNPKQGQGSQNSDGPGMNKNSNNKKKKGARKMKLSELERAEEGNKLNTRSAAANRYGCSICNKWFPSHNRSNSLQIMGESESEAEEDEKERLVEDAFGSSTLELEVNGHQQCHICNKTFPPGRALGGHKRSHWTGIAETRSPGETCQSCPMILNFDLNQPPAMDGEEGVQSDLFITTIVASSGYASSSPNSVTN